MPELQRKAGEIPVNISIRSLRAEEINVRIDQCVEGKALLLLYIDSRACRKILDETFGMFGWRDHYEEIKGALYCTIELWDETKSQWIPKQDCGTASNTEKTKGEASDAFKRACFCAGIGRELYTKIPIWIPIETVEKESNGGRPRYEPKKKYLSFSVSRVEINKKTQKIRYLCVVNDKQERVFEWGFSNWPYVDDDTERARNALLSYCEDYAELVDCEPEAAYKAAMKGQHNTGEGFAQGIVLIKAKIKEKMEKQENDGA